jgi:hypothetical protein
LLGFFKKLYEEFLSLDQEIALSAFGQSLLVLVLQRALLKGFMELTVRLTSMTVTDGYFSKSQTFSGGT